MHCGDLICMQRWKRWCASFFLTKCAPCWPTTVTCKSWTTEPSWTLPRSGTCRNASPNLETDLLGLGLWSDGVPFSWERTESMETWAWFLPGVGSPKWKEARFPFTAFPTSCLAASTCDQILEVWAWSMECLLKRTFPATGPQGREFAGGDAWRRRRAGSPLGVQGVLCQIRGDWKAYKIVFKLPGWKDGLYRCWRCKAHPNTWTQTGIEAAMWRPRLRWQPWELLTVLKRPLSSVWTIPFMLAKTVLPMMRPNWPDECSVDGPRHPADAPMEELSRDFAVSFGIGQAADKWE